MTTTPTSGAADLRTAAQAVVDRWDTPLWKDVPATAEYIGRLRAALAAGQATAAQAVAEPADTVVLNAAMRAIQQAIELIGAPTDERMRAVRRVLRGAVIVAEDAGKVAPLPGTAYAALPEYGINTASHAHFRVLGFTADQMRAFADATHTLRASHGEAPASVLHLVHSAFAEIAMAFPKAFAMHKVGIADTAVLKALAAPATAQAAEPVALLVRKNSWRDGQWEVAPPNSPSYGLAWADQRVHVYTTPQPSPTAQSADSVTAPAPPLECETEAEKRAFAFGWFKALEAERMKADNKKKDPL